MFVAQAAAAEFVVVAVPVVAVTADPVLPRTEVAGMRLAVAMEATWEKKLDAADVAEAATQLETA